MRRRLLTAMLAAGVALAAGGSGPAGALDRATADRPDDSRLPQIHIAYVVPRDGADRSLDTNGSLAGSVSAFGRWLEAQTGGRELRVDTFGGELDVTFFRMSRTDAEVAASGPFVRDRIEEELAAAGLLAPARSTASITTVRVRTPAAAPPGRHVSKGGSPRSTCAPPRPAPSAGAAAFAGPGEPPRYVDFAMLHGLLHTLGLVAECAPHHHRSGHVPEPEDLMYAGDAPWRPTTLDIGHDDYFEHDRAGCPDLAESPYLAPAGGDRTVTHPRTVTLTLRGRLFASGLVRSTGPTECIAGVPVRLERTYRGRRTLAATARTGSAGSFRARLRPRAGVYRAVVAQRSVGGDICAAARSTARRFRR